MLPFVLAGAFVVIAALPDGSTVGGVLAFGLAGLGCSALLPLTISFAQADLVAMSAATAGLVIAAYQLGYGLAAFGAGPLQDAGVTLPAIFAIGAVAAGVMAVLSFVIARPEPRGSRRSTRGRHHLHRRPDEECSVSTPGSNSAMMIRPAASIRARCEKACGKLPRWKPVSTSNSSA